MNWLWQNYSEDGLYRVEWTPWAPGLEVGLDPRAINIMPRFSEVFQPLADCGLTDNPALEDVLLRFLALMDLSCGIDSRQLNLMRLDRELREGLWGKEIPPLYADLAVDEQRTLLNLLHELEKNALPPLDRAITIFFPNSLAYKLEKNGDIILSMPYEKTARAQARLALVLALFLPLRQEIRVYWQKTPCLLDEAEGRVGYCVLG